ncbi:thiamine phosphate synthase [Reichenbachiella carrageenanivorans]|uniref:Thiamine-phosphate synthase n=1 Tax=Reichenbachiella carrageenanivorans TaxID=2979869 RepID=A0ABY6CWV3_9BACT|nr:thiamine phosphate synthase [Reichenbachiella carrageenanivorans]UXX78402.1 thiamine phosphate synthase [Reichenbachiella carrageenanivorans]
MISRLHYISQETDEKSHLDNIREACAAGIDWVQLRVKDRELDEIEEMAFEAKAICKKYGAKLILNDHVEIAKAIKANGVHLGQEDMDPVEARAILGDKPYIGGTANTWEQVELLYESKVVDYVGLGPFKFTTTKENLSPELGIRGYSNILNNMIIQDIDIPIIAIGGIEMEDIFDLQLTGCYGIAVASLINNSFDKKETIEEIKLHLPDGTFDDSGEDF